MAIETVPLKGSFMVTSIVGFIISWMYVLPRNKSWGVTFIIFFVIMFIASLISMTTAPIEAEESLDHKYRKKK